VTQAVTLTSKGQQTCITVFVVHSKLKLLQRSCNLYPINKPKTPHQCRATGLAVCCCCCCCCCYVAVTLPSRASWPDRSPPSVQSGATRHQAEMCAQSELISRWVGESKRRELRGVRSVIDCHRSLIDSASDCVGLLLGSSCWIGSSVRPTRGQFNLCVWTRKLNNCVDSCLPSIVCLTVSVCPLSVYKYTFSLVIYIVLSSAHTRLSQQQQQQQQQQQYY